MWFAFRENWPPSVRENVFKGTPHMVVGSDNKTSPIIKCSQRVKARNQIHSSFLVI